MWARIEGDRVAEITDIDPVGRFHPSLIWVPVHAAGVLVGWIYRDGAFFAPESARVTTESVKAMVTAQRWNIETGGITLHTGVRVDTGIDDQNRITSVIANARLAGLTEVSFKAGSGWVTLTLAELEGVAASIAMHVQQCFNAERAHHEAIDTLQQLHAEDAEALQQALEAYDIEQGWPSSLGANR